MRSWIAYDNFRIINEFENVVFCPQMIVLLIYNIKNLDMPRTLHTFTSFSYQVSSFISLTKCHALEIGHALISVILFSDKLSIHRDEV